VIRPNRLLIIHGLLDENVHYKHSELLSNMLHRHRKPHHLQVYSRERHGLRSLDANEHYETLMYWWLRSYL
jgi:dipeptidyl aminopeptidase/acylaminoacyl peptidase